MENINRSSVGHETISQCLTHYNKWNMIIKIIKEMSTILHFKVLEVLQFIYSGNSANNKKTTESNVWMLNCVW